MFYPHGCEEFNSTPHSIPPNKHHTAQFSLRRQYCLWYQVIPPYFTHPKVSLLFRVMLIESKPSSLFSADHFQFYRPIYVFISQVVFFLRISHQNHVFISVLLPTCNTPPPQSHSPWFDHFSNTCWAVNSNLGILRQFCGLARRKFWLTWSLKDSWK